MRKMLLTTALLAGMAGSTAAQHAATAFRYIIYEGQKVYEKPGLGGFCMGLGLDRTLNERLTIGIDMTYDVGSALRDASIPVAGSMANNKDYSVAPRLLSVNYHTEFALGDDRGTHAYIGSFIGLRHITQQWSISDRTNYEYVFSQKRVSANLVPVGLRLGLRGATDGGFMDVYGQFGYQIGGNKNLLGEKVLGKATYATTSAFALTIGLAYGFGW